ncbi:MAG: glycoside hydrolase family protein [Acidobacteriaceae bacterium]
MREEVRKSRRKFLAGTGAVLASAGMLPGRGLLAEVFKQSEVAPYLTPYKYEKLVLSATGSKGAFDELAVDDPIVFHAEGKFHMLYTGWDGVGYQTGLATSSDLVSWHRVGCVGPRNPASKYTRFNLALNSILRDKELTSRGEALKIGGRYLGAWNAYPNEGYEVGAGVIGLAWSDDLLHWTLTDPILFPQDGAPWEHGGLYRPDLLKHNDTYYLFYNAKTDTLPKSEGGGWHEQTGVATSRDLKTWTRYAGNPILKNGAHDSRDARFASNPFVVRHGGQWGMYYFGFGYERPGHACELLALGHDPYHFSKVNQVLIDAGAPGSVDSSFAHKPSVIYHEGCLYHFYCAVSGKWPHEVRGISVARSKPW